MLKAVTEKAQMVGSFGTCATSWSIVKKMRGKTTRGRKRLDMLSDLEDKSRTRAAEDGVCGVQRDEGS